jgi:hypothetical protein
MGNNKTTCALAIFDAEDSLAMPSYITEALDDLT